MKLLIGGKSVTRSSYNITYGQINVSVTKISSTSVNITFKTTIYARTFLQGFGLTSNEALNCRRCTEVNMVLGLFGPRRPSRGLQFSSIAKPSSKSRNINYYKTYRKIITGKNINGGTERGSNQINQESAKLVGFFFFFTYWCGFVKIY